MAQQVYDPCPHLPLPDTPADPDDPLAGAVEDIAGKVWTQFPWNEKFTSDPTWCDSVGRDYIVQKRIFMLPSDEDQVKETLKVITAFPSRGLNVMFKAAVRGKPHIIKALLDHGVKAHPAAPGEQGEDEANDDDDGLVPIHAAAFQGHVECVKLLVEQGHVDPDISDVTSTPLQRAGMAGNADVVRYLLGTGKVDVHRRFVYQGEAKHPLQWIVRSGNSETANVLIDAFLGIADATSSTEVKVVPASTIPNVAIGTAATDGNLDVLQRLLTLRGLVDNQGQVVEPLDRVVDDEGRTVRDVILQAISKAANGAKVENFQYLASLVPRDYITISIEVSEQIREGYYMGLLTTAEEDNILAFDVLASYLFAEDKVRQLPYSQFILRWCLHQAASKDLLPMVKHLIEQYAVDINDGSRNDKDVVPPLIAASAMGHTDIVRYLLEECPVQADITLSAGQVYIGPPLWHAVKKKSMPTVALLLKHGAPVHFVSEQRPGGAPAFVRIAAHLCPDAQVQIFTDESDWDNAKEDVASYVDVDASDDELRAVILGRYST